MTNSFLASARIAVRDLRRARSRHQLWRTRADIKLVAAKDAHAQGAAKALEIEEAAWRQLLSIPGMSNSTAARLLDIEESEVVRWARAMRTSTRSVEGHSDRTEVQA